MPHEMRYTTLGRTGLRVSRLCLGTMNFGWTADEPASFAIMDRAVDLGLNFFDSADQYGWGGERGDTERIIGRWWADDPAKRNCVVLATKVYHAMPEGHPDANRGTPCLNARKIVRHCEDCLSRLKTDRIDLLQMHHVDRACPAEEIWQAMDTLVTQGKIVYAGSSNFAGWQIATLNQVAARRSSLGLVSEQSLYNLTNRAVELEVVPACRHYGVGLIPYSPLGAGMLAGITEASGAGGRARRDDDKVRGWLAARGEAIRAWEALCAGLGRPPADVALAWLLHQDAVTAPIIGPRTIEQLDRATDALGVTLTRETLAELDAIWPGPGGEAPEAYAW